MIENEHGQTAICYYQTIPHALRVSQHTYTFVVQANICMAWVNNEDVERVLATTKQCNCGSNRKTVYRYANEADVRRWSGINER